jgi:hypothetical protein
MQIEIVGFYVIERDDAKEKLTGTLHVYLVEEGIDIRGCYVVRKKSGILIFLPSKIGVDEDTGKKVQYPVFQYMDTEKNKELLIQIRYKGISYILDEVLKLKDKRKKNKKETIFRAKAKK